MFFVGEEGRNAQGVYTQTGKFLVRWKASVRIKTTSGQIGILPEDSDIFFESFDRPGDRTRVAG